MPYACGLRLDWAERDAHQRGFATPIFCAVGGLTDFAFACLLQKQIELNVG